MLSLHEGRVTGVLVVRKGEIARRIYLYQGVFSRLQSTAKVDSLSAVLVAKGWLTEEKLKEIQARRSVGQSSGGVLKPDDLPQGLTVRDALRMQVQEVAASS